MTTQGCAEAVVVEAVDGVVCEELRDAARSVEDYADRCTSTARRPRMRVVSAGMRSWK